MTDKFYPDLADYDSFIIRFDCETGKFSILDHVRIEKAIKVAIECMEVIGKQKHRENLAGFSPNAEKRENEITSAISCLTEYLNSRTVSK